MSINSEHPSYPEQGESFKKGKEEFLTGKFIKTNLFDRLWIESQLYPVWKWGS